MTGAHTRRAPEVDAIPRGTLRGQVALVTGASRGLGRAIAVELARAGADIVVNHRNSTDAATRVACEVEAAGSRALVVQADVSDPGDVERLYQAAGDRFGSVDILVNNAGANGSLTRGMLDVSIEGVRPRVRHQRARTVPV